MYYMKDALSYDAKINVPALAMITHRYMQELFDDCIILPDWLSVYYYFGNQCIFYK